MNKWLVLLCLGVATAQAATFPSYVRYTTCFTPTQQCTPVLVGAINNSRHTILVQAYSFTSKPILKALKQAYDRGVDVRVILDKSQVSKTGKYTSATYLIDAGIPTWVDYRPAIAHNKIMIFDGNAVETGSFNYTEGAEKRNAENFIIISDAALAKTYADNWENRQLQSKKLN